MTETCDDKDEDVIIIPHTGGTTIPGSTTTFPTTGGGLINFDDILNSAPPSTGGGLIAPGGTINVPTGGQYPLPPVPQGTIITTPGDDRLILYVIPPPVPDIGLPIDNCTPVPGPGGGTGTGGGGTTAGLAPDGQRAIFPSKPGGRYVTTAGTEFKTRHYASGMPELQKKRYNDPSVEVTLDSAGVMNQELTCIVQMAGMNHNDTIEILRKLIIVVIGSCVVLLTQILIAVGIVATKKLTAVLEVRFSK
jgi:hypothetical protein